ncbi:hypothetical protein ASZ78_007450 [Callipepla squamata]|uniref:non-specific serine/threonine protein kinase n=1 Tax=Callipepla squamata TaxID=9009 RepID=A0A226MUY8_CALSU|nr:hypothetical protein ASZ78_007450 [Callipepla squamata]
MILKDTEGKAWRLGSQIGHGGFGLIYLASPHTHVPVEDDAVHVIKVLDTLEYIHENEYVHGDIKAANLLLGYTNSHEVYLADYGLSYRYCPNGNHKQYQENPRKGHNGTIEFTSIDAHKGVGRLMDELPDSVMEWDSSGSSCSELSKFLERVYGLAYDEKPKYQELKKILLDGLELSGTHYDGPLEFSTAGCTQNHCTAKVSKVKLLSVHQQVHFTKPSPNPVKQKQKMQEDTCEYPGRHQAWIMHRKSQAEEKPIKPSSTIQETDPQKYPYSGIPIVVFSQGFLMEDFSVSGLENNFVKQYCKYIPFERMFLKTFKICTERSYV